jgi:hypothetical protein
MKNFILSANPNFSDAKIAIDGVNYSLIRNESEGDGCVFVVNEPNRTTEQVYLPRRVMKALYKLLQSNLETAK